MLVLLPVLRLNDRKARRLICELLDHMKHFLLASLGTG